MTISPPLLHPAAGYAIFKTQKEQPPTRWVDLKGKLEIHRITTPLLAKVPGWFFYALKHYLINVNTNVSNARMNIPNAIRSLKSKWLLFISTTPILCKMEVSHPATRLLQPQYNIMLSCKQSDFRNGSSPVVLTQPVIWLSISLLSFQQYLTLQKMVEPS